MNMQERITVVLQAVTGKFNQQIESAGKSIENLKKNINGFNVVMQQPMDRFKRLNGRMKGMNTTGGKFARGVRQWTHGMRGFRMEMLGVMFAGMALSRVFMSMLQPAAEAFGVFDLFKDTLLVMMVPIMDALMPFFISLADFFMNMPEPLQKVIGVIAILGVVLGTLLSVVGSFALGAGSIIQAFGFIFSATFGSIIAVIAGVILIISGFVDIVKGKWEGLGKIIMGIGVVLFLFIGWWALIPIAIGAAVWAIIKYWTPIKEFFSGIWTAIKSFFEPVTNWFSNVFSAAANAIKAIWNPIATFFSNLWSGIWDNMKSFINTVISGFNSMINLLNKIKVKAPDWVTKLTGMTSFGFNIPNIPKLASGGIINKPTIAMVGEAGPEAVVPLNKSSGFNSGGVGGVINFSPVYNINVSNMTDLKKLIEDNNRKIVDDLKRLSRI